MTKINFSVIENPDKNVEAENVCNLEMFLVLEEDGVSLRCRARNTHSNFAILKISADGLHRYKGCPRIFPVNPTGQIVLDEQDKTVNE